MEPTLLVPEVHNDSGDCWTCHRHKRNCDRTLPNCQSCINRGITCLGYEVRLSWPDEVLKPKRQSRNRRRRLSSPGSSSSSSSSTPYSSLVDLEGISSLNLPQERSYYMQHFLHNISRVALAIDHQENGYRSLLPMALGEPAVLNAVLAVAASHHCRWKRVEDRVSMKYLGAARKALWSRFQRPDLIYSPVTLTCMLLSLTYEVFAGSSRWREHYDAIRGWVRARKSCKDVDHFLMTWVCLVDTQAALNLGTSTMPELDEWMDASLFTQGHVIDSLFGCLSRLPKLMAAASRLYVSSKDEEADCEDIRTEAEFLQSQILDTKLPEKPDLRVGLCCSDISHDFSTAIGIERDELHRRAIATAEIFRHALHIYVYRIVHDPLEPLSAEMQRSLEAALELLTQVPDALGPGANLGWCLVVIGAELDLEEQRQYVNSRWAGLHLLGMYNSKSGQKIVNEVWNRRDEISMGLAMPERWQDTMQRVGHSQILV